MKVLGSVYHIPLSLIVVGGPFFMNRGTLLGRTQKIFFHLADTVVSVVISSKLLKTNFSNYLCTYVYYVFS